ncbi:DUF418 domain-containing protein [Brachybacterium sp.]|uniref:DUF418 domain-containing protein n=1 Tax=Brachybacterium sp. TaxID=1891286 RepID=UPI002ED05E48
MTSAADAPPVPARTTGPTPTADRAPAPDLARGMMLLLIALAHAPWFLYTSHVGASPMHPADGSVTDRLAQLLTITVVDARTHTMFGLLFAYGIGQMLARQSTRGVPESEARRLLRRRHLWMLALGLVHAALLWQGDIVGTYGLIGLLMLPLFLRRSDRTLAVSTLVLLGVCTTMMLLTAAASGSTGADAAAGMQRLSLAEPSYLASVPIRLAQWGFGLVSGVVTLALPVAFLLGLLAARHRLLEEPEKHLRLLRWVAGLGIGLGWGVGLTQALVHLGVLTVPSTALLESAHFLTGIGAGAGYAALFGLLVHALRSREDGAGLRSRPVRALSALGRRSLSGYLAQSLVYGPLLAAWGLGLGAHLSSFTALLIAVAVWTTTLLGALALERSGRRGPAEVLLRRLTYGASG